MKKYLITLTEKERHSLHTLVRSGNAGARKITRARILLKPDQSPDAPAWTDQQICVALDIGVTTVECLRKRFVEDDLTVALHRRKHRTIQFRRKLDGHQEVQLVTLACSRPPEGRDRWTLRLLADTLVELEIVDTISYQTVRRVLKKSLKPWLNKSWVMPPQADAEFVYRMEHLLDLYTQPYDPT